MYKTVKISKGLNINLKGDADRLLQKASRSKMYAVKPNDFYGITPKLVARVGDRVKVGDVLFFSKKDDRIKITSPVSGQIEEIVRGEKRKILKILIKPDTEDTYKEFDSLDVAQADKTQILDQLLESGLFTYIKQRPYDIIASPDDKPKAIFISAYDSAPLSYDYDFALRNRQKDFQTGIDALKKLTEGKIYIITNGNTVSDFEKTEGVEIIKAFGPHPVGNVSIHIEKFEPLDKNSIVWVVNPVSVALMGSFFSAGKYNPEKHVALAGSKVKKPHYISIIPGADLSDIIKNDIEEDARLISGNVLTGQNVTKEPFLNYFDHQITAIPSGNKPRFMGWLPFFGENRKSFYRFNLSPWRKVKYDGNLYGEERAFVMNEEFESVMPLSIYPTHLLKAAILGDVEKMEQLGIFEVAPEDFALLDYISSSKIDTQDLIRKGLDEMKIQLG